MIDYYKNLNKMFSVWNTYYNKKSFDLYFIGIKKGSKNMIHYLNIVIIM